MKNEYVALGKKRGLTALKQLSAHPLFGYVILSVILAIVQLLFMFTDGLISLTVSRAVCQSMIYTVAALGLGILLGLAGLVSLGTAAFIGLGAYIAGNILKVINLPYIIILLAVSLVALVLGVVVGFISLRVRGVHLLIITLALAYIFNELYAQPNKFTGGPNGLTRVPFPKLLMMIQLNRETVFFVVLVVLFIAIMLTVNIIDSPSGRAMLAMRSSESLAQAMGISILKYRMLAFVVATEYAMIAGALYISSIAAANPYSWNLTLSLNILAAVILGGGAKPVCSIMGSFIIFCLDLAILKNIPFFQKNSSASLIFSGVLIILIVVKYPGGLMRLLSNINLRVKNLVKKWRVYRYGSAQ